MEPESGLAKPSELVQVVGATEVHIDMKSMLSIVGTDIDWKDDLMGSRFTFQNKTLQGTNSIDWNGRPYIS